jgi:periplasmic protein TonB
LDEQYRSQPSSYDGAVRAQRQVAAFAASIAAHAAIVALIVWFVSSPVARGHSEWVVAYLVEGTGGALGRGIESGRAGASSIRAADVAIATMRIAPPKAARKPHRRIERSDSEVAGLASVRAVAPARPAASKRDPAAALSAATASRSGGVGIDAAGTAAAVNGGGAGGGAAGGGDANSMAHADYASNPPPAYPPVARRREQQGTVTVRVLVGADGSVERAEIADSSGFETLDDAALETVRSRWRFVPARRGGIAVESWVLVPIRFALVEASANRSFQ